MSAIAMRMAIRTKRARRRSRVCAVKTNTALSATPKMNEHGQVVMLISADDADMGQASLLTNADMGPLPNGRDWRTFVSCESACVSVSV